MQIIETSYRSNASGCRELELPLDVLSICLNFITRSLFINRLNSSLEIFFEAPCRIRS